MTTITEVDFTKTYRVEGYGGIAFRVLSYVQEWTEDEYVLVCTDEDCAHDTESCYAYERGTPTENLERVNVVMVGDDTIHNIGVDELQPLAEDAYCVECGQVGCSVRTANQEA